MDYNKTIENIEEDLDLIQESVANLKSITYGKAPGFIKALAQNALNNITKVQSDLKDIKTNIAWENSSSYISKMIASENMEEQPNVAKSKKPSKKQIDETFYDIWSQQ